MILLTLLAIITIILMVVVVTALSAIGASAIIIFGDVIVCIFILGWIIKKLIKRKRR